MDQNTFNGARVKRWILPCILLTTLLLIGPSLQNQFLLWDDQTLVTANPLVQPTTLGEIFRVWDPRPAMSGQTPEYFPIRDTVYATLYFVFGLTALPHHVLLLLLFLVNVVLVHWVAERLLKDTWAVAIATLLFALHPIHVEVFSWVSGLKDLLMGTFLLWGALAMLRFSGSMHEGVWRIGARRHGVLMVLCSVGAMLSKHVGVISVGLYGLYFVVFSWRAKAREGDSREAEPGERDWRRLWWPVAISGLCAIGVAALSIEIGKNNLELADTMVGADNGEFSIAVQPLVQVDNVKRLIAPWNLKPIYEAPSVDVTVGLVLAYLVCFAALLALVVAWRRGGRMVVFLSGWCVLGVAPFAFARVGSQFTTDRYLYFSSIGFCLLIAYGAKCVERRFHWGGASARALALALAVFYAFGIRHSLPLWRDTGSFYAEFLQRAPHTVHAVQGWAGYLDSQERFDESLKYYKIVELEHAEYFGVEAEANVCIIEHKAGRIEEAIAHAEDLVKRYPNEAIAHNTLGLLWARSAHPNRALPSFLSAIRLDDKLHEAHLNYVRALTEVGRTSLAMEHAERLRATARPKAILKNLDWILSGSPSAEPRMGSKP